MSVTINDVKYIADLARLNFEEKELEGFTIQFNDILSFFEKLNELDTENLEPLSYPIPSQNVFRDDILKSSASQEEALKNAPDRSDEFFKVPKVINQ